MKNIKRKLIQWGDFLFFWRLKTELRGMNSVLDLGCGRDSPLGKIQFKPFSVGVDVFKKSLEISKKKKIHNKYIKADVLQIDNLFSKKSFDVVVALDLIEHLDKEDGVRLINKMQKLAKKKIIILTPRGFTHQKEYEDNLYQVHKSGWTIKDFKSLGFDVYGLRGWSLLRGECATLKYKPWVFWGLISFLSDAFIYYIPQYAYHLFAVKNLTKKF